MTLLRWHRLGALGVGLLTLACDSDSTEPPGPPAEVVKSGGDGQTGYFNNPLPVPYSVTVRDANGRAVPGVSVDWTFVTGGGSLSPDPSTTNANGVASTIHTLGTATTYVVNATVTGLPPVTFSTTASAPPTTGSVRLLADVHYVGARFSGDISVNPRPELPSYGYANFGASYRVPGEAIAISADLLNAFQSKGLEEGNPRLVAASRPQFFARPILPRALQVSMGYTF